MALRKEQTGAVESYRKYQVYISSTFRDLADQRRMVLDVVVDRGHMPIALERFPAKDTTVPSVIYKSIDACQIYIVILGYRYGSIVKGEDISFSQLEYVMAFKQKKIVVPFVLTEAEVRKERKLLDKQLDKAKTQVSKLAKNTFERNELEKEIAELEAELANEDKLNCFRSLVTTDRFYQPFSLEKCAYGSSDFADLFDKNMVFKALLIAEELAVEKRISGWIKEPKDRILAETVEAVSRNRFLVDVVGAMAKFDPLVPRIRDQAEEKEAAASFFVDKYLQQLLAKNVSLFFESGSSIAYVAQIVGERLKELNKEIQISTNNILAYLIFWLVHRIRCSLFPWGPPEEHYGAVFGPVNEFVPECRTPYFPPEPLSSQDEKAIRLLRSDHFCPANWDLPVLMLGALSGLQLKRDTKISNCLGPHVGSPRNKVFKRFMYATKLPLMLFMTVHKIDSPVDLGRCHFILDQEDNGGLMWEDFFKKQPIAFCVGCENNQTLIDDTVKRFEELELKVIRAGHKTLYTAFIARNQEFIDDLEAGMNIH